MAAPANARRKVKDGFVFIESAGNRIVWFSNSPSGKAAVPASSED